MNMHAGWKRYLTLVVVLNTNAFGAVQAADRDADAGEYDILGIPYGFHNENFGLAVGYAYGKFGFPQPQSSLIGTVMAGANESVMGFGMLDNYLIPGTDRLFMDAVAFTGIFGDIDAYVDGNPLFPNERAGSNDSNEDNFINGDGTDLVARVRFRYLLPIGDGAATILPDYKLVDGLLVDGASGGSSWHPFASGRTYLQLEPFYRYQEIDSPANTVELATNGIDSGIFWDNRDFPANPSRGNSVRVRWARDFGWLDSTDDWSNLQLEYDHYIDLGDSSWFRQQVLALNFWTSYSPSWEEPPNGKVTNRPPPYTGSSLGGLWRMRGLPSGRFNDQAAIYYAAELRLIPHANPFDRWTWLQERVGIEWIQLVPFVEVGRVAPGWSLSELHEDMKVNAGIGLRFSAQGFVLRVDVAASEEDVRVNMMVGQPFQF